MICEQHEHYQHRRNARQSRLDQAGAVAVCGVPGGADRAAAVVACGLQRHRQGPPTHAAKFRHTVHRSVFPRSAADHRHYCHHIGRDLLRCRGADGVAGVAHRHAGTAIHSRAGHGVVRDAGEHLFNIYSMTGIIFVISCYTFPFVFVLVANALDNMPGELEDASAILGGKAWTTARRVTIPLALPALVAGALIAFLQAMTLFGSPAILALPAGFHTMTTKIWSLFQYPPKLELAA